MAKYITVIVMMIFILLGISMFLVGKYCKKKSLKISLAIVISLLTLYCILISFDMNRVYSSREPIFARKNEDMGNISRYDGLGYKIDIEKDYQGNIIKTEMTMFGKVIAATISLPHYLDDTLISTEIIERLSATSKIVMINENVDNDDNIIGTITDENIIEEVISIMANSTTIINGNYNCMGATLFFEMYDIDNKLIDKVDVRIDGSVMPRSIDHGGCGKYSLESTDINTLNIIIEQQSGIKFYTIYDYSEECDQALELIYEDNNSKYYFNCIKSDKVFIEFRTTKLKITVKEALKDKYIKVDELVKAYPDLFIKLEK